MRIQFIHSYDSIISLENLLEAWGEFVKGKKSRKDVQEFERDLMANIILLHKELLSKTYKHSPYEAFNISDPKPRNIHKATVRDRLLHHAIYRRLYPFFDRVFISDSYSCRFKKGTHRALNRFEGFANKISQNYTKMVWILKCDIRKFFASIDQVILLEILEKYIPDKDIIWLIKGVIKSFEGKGLGKGLPLGNLTSQLLVNIYMNDFDQFMKHRVKAKYYIRYADDFVIMYKDRESLEEFLNKIKEFLFIKLKLELHPNKVSITTLASGVDFLGWVNFPDHRVLRKTTKRRMFKKLRLGGNKPEVANSYLGLLSHGNAGKLSKRVMDVNYA